MKDAEFTIVDFDRTVVDTDKLSEVFFGIVDAYDIITREELRQADAEVKSQGDSFDTAGYVRDKMRENDRTEDWEDLEKEFIRSARSLSMLLSGAAELLEYLTLNQQNFGILTYGNPFWQRLKISAAGFNHVPRIITPRKDKGRIVSDWQQSDGTFQLPQEFGGGVVEKIAMFDDKAVSFAEFPGAPSYGYWVCDPAHELPAQQGSVPDNVERVNDLWELLDKLPK